MSRLDGAGTDSRDGTLAGRSSPLTPLIGRERELAVVIRLLAGNRLVTLTGAGGVGKTRLALAAAAAASREFADGCDLIELDTIHDAALLPAALAAALGVAGSDGTGSDGTGSDGAGTGGSCSCRSCRSCRAGTGPCEHVVRALRGHRRLLVLDNCEQVRVGCAGIAAAILGRCPGVTVLATSRSPLGVPGEVTWRVPSLAFPWPGHSLPGGGLTGFPAVALFLDRARAARPGISLGPGDEAAITAICYRLDGIPLALELAATRAGAMTLPEIAARLTGCMELLAADGVGPARQQTLRASVDWSFSLLPAAERVVFRRLAVFRGGWTLRAAEEVCADDEGCTDDDGGGADDGSGGSATPITAERVAGLLASLADRSLVQAEQTPAGSRYRFPAVIRAFAAERLAAAGEEGRIRERHARYSARASEAGANHPRASQPSASQPSADRPSADRPGADRPSADRPGAGWPALGPPGLTQAFLSQAGPSSLGAGGSPLTQRELQIAGLLTTGLTNRQIGARLFIAERTVDTHVGRILAKLGCATRTQVAALMTATAAAAAGSQAIPSAGTAGPAFR